MSDNNWHVVDFDTGLMQVRDFGLAEARKWLDDYQQQYPVCGTADVRVARWDIDEHQWVEPEPEPEPIPYSWQVLAQKGCLLSRCSTKAGAVAQVRRLDIDRPSTAPHRVAQLIEHTPDTIPVLLPQAVVEVMAANVGVTGFPDSTVVREACAAALNQEEAT